MPLGEPLLELRHAPLHEPQVAGPTLEIVEGRRERSGAVAGALEGSVELAGALFQSLGDARGLRPQLRCPLEMLRGGIEHDPLPLDLPPHRPRLFGERVDAPAAGLAPRDSGVRLRPPALDPGHTVRPAPG